LNVPEDPSLQLFKTLEAALGSFPPETLPRPLSSDPESQNDALDEHFGALRDGSYEAIPGGKDVGLLVGFGEIVGCGVDGGDGFSLTARQLPPRVLAWVYIL
jgi:hypothetical protein